MGFQLVKHALILVICSSSCAGILDSTRITKWSPGVLGGIPFSEGPIVNVVEYGAPNDSSGDASVAILEAMSSLEATGGIVFIPEGVYHLEGQILFSGDNIILRGEGPEKTKLYSSFAGNSVSTALFDEGEWQPILEGALKSSNRIVVPNPEKFTIGEFAEVQQENDSVFMYTLAKYNQSWAENAAGQILEISKIIDDTIVFRTELHFSMRMDLSPEVRPKKLRRGIGVENLYIKKNVPDGNTFEIRNSAYSWIRGVHSEQTRYSHVEISRSLGVEVRESLFHHSFNYGGGGSAYGVEFGVHSTDGLVEDNIFYHLRHAMMVHLGAIGCVFGYNYSFEPVQAEGGDDLSMNVGWDPPDVSLHGHFAQFNLFESNEVAEVGIADYWGPMGPGNTFLRNNVFGQEGIVLNDKSHKQNLIGNKSDEFANEGKALEVILHGNDFGEKIEWDSTNTDTFCGQDEALKCPFWDKLQQFPFFASGF